MKRTSRIKGITGHILALMLTFSLIAGAAGAGESFAAVSTSSPYDNTKSSYVHNTKYDGNLIVHGVDVSYYQSVASDWNAAKKMGCDYAIMRVTYTTYAAGNLYIDSKFATHFKKAKAAGVMKGVYVFSQATSVKEARKEAQFAVDRLRSLGIGPADVELPVYMDYEFAGRSRGSNRGRLYGINKKTAIDCVNAFAEVIRANGYDPGVYANTNFFRTYLGNGTAFATDIDMWDAQYYHKNESGSNYSKWQYTSTAKVDGILYYATNKKGSTDADFWYLNKNSNPSAITQIYGNTKLAYTGKAVLPQLEIYEGETLLKEGTDYIIGGVNNVKKGSSGAYAYVKGIGRYGGYALVPLSISKKYIDHIGLACVGGSLLNRNGGEFRSATNDNGSYVRNVPEGIKAGELLKKLKVRTEYKGKYKLKVIDAKGKIMSKDKTVSTGMMIGVFSGSELKGTADITVNGSTVNEKGANYLVKVDRSNPVYPALGSAPEAGDGDEEETVSVDDDLKVDGIGGTATVKKFQKLLGVKQSGYITVRKDLYKYNPAFKAVKFGKKDKKTVKALQKWLGLKADGLWGKKTTKALQKKIGVKANGVFDKKSMKALQKYLNEHA